MRFWSESKDGLRIVQLFDMIQEQGFEIFCVFGLNLKMSSGLSIGLI